MQYSFNNNCVVVNDIGYFNLEKTLESGQCFRWAKTDGGYKGIAFNKTLFVKQNEENLEFYCSLEDFEKVWLNYFALNEDYESIDREILNCEPVLKGAAEISRGIRVLRQDPWEALCSFIVSQNSNIPKIKLSISRLCQCFGEKLSEGEYSFPSAQKIAQLSVDDLAPLRCGYRAPYIINGAGMVANNQLDLNSIRTLPIEEARAELMRIKGVGKKVADCALLYGFERLDCFPVDRWIIRAMETYFPNGSPITMHKYAGIAQLYIFNLMINGNK